MVFSMVFCWGCCVFGSMNVSHALIWFAFMCSDIFGFSNTSLGCHDCLLIMSYFGCCNRIRSMKVMNTAMLEEMEPTTGFMKG
jgi:hypothetical protein